jgi:hypothetical protein
VEFCAVQGFFGEQKTSLVNIFILIIVVCVSMVLGSWIGNAMQKSIRIGPTIIGSCLGAILSVLLMPVLEGIIDYFTPFEFGMTMSVIVVSVGIFFGALAGFRLSFLVMLST